MTNISEVSNCRLCDSHDYSVVDTEVQHSLPYTIVKCNDCSLIYVRDSYATLSPEYTNLKSGDLDEEHIWRQSKHKELAFRQCLGLYNKFNQRKQSLGKPYLLDVGCGIGGWLSYAQNNFECYGFDASEAQIMLAQKSFNNTRQATSFSEYKNSMGAKLPKFDLITMWDVLEHIRQPQLFLEELGSALSPSGLVFIAVPAATPMLVKHRLLSVGWPRNKFSWNPREHVCYYSPKTLRMVLSKSGFETLRIGSVEIYPRPITTFEIIRRFGFWISKSIPNLAPQIYALARNNSLVSPI